MNVSSQLKFAVGLCGDYMRDIVGINAADEFIDDVLTRTAPSGERPLGSIGPYENGDSFTPQLSIAFGFKHAYLRWDDSIAVEPDYAVLIDDAFSLTIHDTNDDIVEVPPAHLLVSPGRARQAVREYVETGQKPACVQWRSIAS